MKITLRLLGSFFVMSCLISLLSCDKLNITEQNFVTDYSKPEHWLSLPTDASKVGDVFYVYPTAWYKEDISEPDFCAIDSQGNLGKVPNFADARINLEKGVIECSSVDDSAMFEISGTMGLGVYPQV
jgi:hypothetical protein